MTSGVIVPRAIPRPGASLRRVAQSLVSSAKHVLAHNDAPRHSRYIPRRILGDKANTCSAIRLACSAPESVQVGLALKPPPKEDQAKVVRTKASSIAVRKGTQASQRDRSSIRFSTPLAVPSPHRGVSSKEMMQKPLSTRGASTSDRFVACPRIGAHVDSRVLAAPTTVRSLTPPQNAEFQDVLSALPPRPLEHIFEPLTPEESREMDAPARGSFSPASDICSQAFGSDVLKDATISLTDEHFNEPGVHPTTESSQEAEATPEVQGGPSFEDFLRVEAECIRLRREVQQWHELFEKVI